MRALLLTALILGCATPAPQLPAPAEAAGRPVSYRFARLPQGVYGEAHPMTGEIYLTHEWETLPPWARVYVVTHELCHMAGHYSEEEADACALERMREAGYLPSSWLALLALWGQRRLGPIRTGRLLEEREGDTWREPK